MIKVKADVEPPIVVLQAAITNAYFLVFPLVPSELLITAGRNGAHKTGSRHYDDAALDVRSKTFAADYKLRFVEAVIRRLGTPVAVETPSGPGYQTKNGKWLGILEFQGLPREHFHFELN